MHIHRRAFFAVLCATFSAPMQADDFVSLVEENFPYQEVDESYGAAQLQDGGCQEGTPFRISQEGSQTITKIDVAKQIHKRLRSLGANAFVIAELKEDTHVRSILVIPLACKLR